MTSLSSIFRELTENKVRLIRRLVFLQIVTGILLGSWTLFYSTFESENKTYFLTSFITITPLFDVAYLFPSSKKNEQVYISQTWRLAPVKRSTLLLANLFSAVVDGLCLVVIQLTMVLIAGLPIIGTNEF